MATRCPRCQKNEIALETFGVYRCPACGRIDADGNLLDIAAPPPEGVPEGRVSFAAPPPKEWVPPSPIGAPVAARAVTNDGPPNLLYAGVALMAFVSLANAITTGWWPLAILDWGMLAALWTGRPWARALSIVGSLLQIAAVALFMAAFRSIASSAATMGATLSIIANIGWLYVLFRPDTVKHFTRRA